MKNRIYVTIDNMLLLNTTKQFTTMNSIMLCLEQAVEHCCYLSWNTYHKQPCL